MALTASAHSLACPSFLRDAESTESQQNLETKMLAWGSERQPWRSRESADGSQEDKFLLCSQPWVKKKCRNAGVGAFGLFLEHKVGIPCSTQQDCGIS